MNIELFPMVAVCVFLILQMINHRMERTLINLKNENANAIIKVKELTVGAEMHPDVEALVGVLQEFARQYKLELADLSRKIDLLSPKEKSLTTIERQKKDQINKRRKERRREKRQELLEASGAKVLRVKSRRVPPDQSL